MIRELTYTELKPNFESSGEAEAYGGLIGQERAETALRFGLGMKRKGYNIYVAGARGSGKTSFAEKYAREFAAKQKTPDDLCYVYNFKNPKEPLLLTFPAGKAADFKTDVEELIERLQDELPRTFSEKAFEQKRGEIMKEFQDIRESLIKEMSDDVKEQNFGVKTTNSGVYFMPIVNGEAISEEQFDELNQDEKDVIAKNSEVIQRQASQVMGVIKEYEKATRKNMNDLEYSAGLFTVGRFAAPLLARYADNEKAYQYLLDVKEDVLANVSDFFEPDPEEEDQMKALLPWYPKKEKDEIFAKYMVNVLQDNSAVSGAPVVSDICPGWLDLVGEIEYDSEYGNLTTDFMKIKPGLLHKANGGYLILQAYEVLTNGLLWDALRRALLNGKIAAEYSREHSSGILLSSLKPEPIPLELKVILVGDGYFYDILYNYDDEFPKLFKTLVEFDYEMRADAKNISELTGFIKRFAKDEGLREFDCGAAARVVEYSSRMAENQKKLTAALSRISEILVEADVRAEEEGASVVTRAHVDRAVAERERRLNLYEEKLSEMIEDDIIMIDTHGGKVGQINGLAVIDTGGYIFAKPTKITATTYMGKAGIVNIEKEAEMSGSIHNKGMQVLIGYLGQTYAQEFPLSLSCRICFEQNYSGIDGDSASSTELYAVLSSVSGLPISQGIAVTGSINQIGEIQPIGGVTYKAEGFFDLCEKRGLTGSQGVMIPARNTADLVLKDSVIDAVKEGMFHIWAIDRVDDGIKLLTGCDAGVKNEKGKYPSDSVHGKVTRKLRDFYKKSLAEPE